MRPDGKLIPDLRYHWFSGVNLLGRIYHNLSGRAYVYLDFIGVEVLAVHYGEFHEKVLDCVNSTTSLIQNKKIEATKTTLEKGISILHDRHKLILIADSARLGWKVVEEYEFN